METQAYEEMYRIEEKFWWFRAKREIIIDLIERYSPDKQHPNILDIGCGCGYTMLELSRKFENVKGIDISDKAVDFCLTRGVNVQKALFPEEIPFSETVFDIIIMSDVLEHIENDRKALEKALEILKPGGMILLTVPVHPFLWSKHDDFLHHKRRYTKKRFSEVFEKLPLERVVFSYYNSLLFPIAYVTRIISKIFRLDKSVSEKISSKSVLNDILERIFASEKFLLGKIPLPVGLSMIAIYKKTSVASEQNQV
jgi:SAM-dependent methyltransferase